MAAPSTEDTICFLRVPITYRVGVTTGRQRTPRWFLLPGEESVPIRRVGREMAPFVFEVSWSGHRRTLTPAPWERAGWFGVREFGGRYYVPLWTRHGQLTPDLASSLGFADDDAGVRAAIWGDLATMFPRADQGGRGVRNDTTYLKTGEAALRARLANAQLTGWVSEEQAVRSAAWERLQGHLLLIDGTLWSSHGVTLDKFCWRVWHSTMDRICVDVDLCARGVADLGRFGLTRLSDAIRFARRIGSERGARLDEMVDACVVHAPDRVAGDDVERLSRELVQLAGSIPEGASSSLVIELKEITLGEPPSRAEVAQVLWLAETIARGSDARRWDDQPEGLATLVDRLEQWKFERRGRPEIAAAVRHHADFRKLDRKALATLA